MKEEQGTVYESKLGKKFKILKVTKNSGEIRYEIYTRLYHFKAWLPLRHEALSMNVSYSSKDKALEKVRACILYDEYIWSNKTAKEEWL